jgi:penicillin-binding protein 2
MTRRAIRTDVRPQLQAVPFSAAIVKTDVSQPVVDYLSEHARSFPGVTVDKLWLRSYPHHQIAAHIFGTVGEVTAEQLKQRRYAGVAEGDRIGQSGIESSYDRFLRGKNGARRVVVDASGDPRSSLGSVQPVAGHQLRLSLDLNVQRTGQQAISGDEGAFVAMDVHTGAILGLGSSPSFDPNLFSKGIRQRDYKRLNNDPNHPLADRAIQGLYPTGSTFKLITATAALQGGLLTPDETLFDPGYFKVGGVTFKNAEGAANGALQLRKALQVSDDVFFYQLGLKAYNSGNGQLIQRWARRYGLGQDTGIDLPGESKGLIAGPAAKKMLYKYKLADTPQWYPGDNVNFSVGQGFLQVTPLQLAVAYAAFANGGTLLRPHLGERIEDSSGRVVQEFQTRSRGKLHIDPGNRQAIMDGLRAAASQPGGTSYAVFKGFPIPVAGKTGTAEKGLGRKDQSWYVAMAPYPAVRYVVAVTAEHGGFGADTAAPEARKILAALFGIKDHGPAPNPNAGRAGVVATTPLGSTG